MTAEARVTLAHPVQVKVIMTQTFRDSLRQEVQASMAQVEDNLERLQSVVPPEGEAPPWLSAELARLTRLKGELEWRLREAEQVQDGAEIPLTSYQGMVEVGVGDNFREKVISEVVLKDWVVVAVRRGP